LRYQIKKYGNYRIVCRFGYDSIISIVWWGYLQREDVCKFWPWSKPKNVWTEIHQGWWDKNFNTMEQLKEAAMKMYKENGELPQQIVEAAMLLK